MQRLQSANKSEQSSIKTPLRSRDEPLTADIPAELAFHLELVTLLGWCAANRNAGLH